MISRSWHFFPARGRGGRRSRQHNDSSLLRDLSSLLAHLCHTSIVQAHGSFGAPHMRVQGEIFRDFDPPAPPEARQHYAHRPPSAPTRPKRAPRATGTGTRAVGALGTRPSTLRRHSGAHARLCAVATYPQYPPRPGATGAPRRTQPGWRPRGRQQRGRQRRHGRWRGRRRGRQGRKGRRRERRRRERRLMAGPLGGG